MAHLTSGFLMLLSVAAAMTVSAQQENCAKQVVVSSEADLSSIASCSTFSGSVTISGANINNVAWPTLTSLTGTIQVTSNPHLATFHLDNLKTSTGSIALYNNTALNSFTISNLKSLNALEIVTAPNLRHLSLSSVDTMGTLKIEDTGLDNSGALPWSTVHKATNMGISNNKFLRNIDMPSLKTVSGRFIIAANGLLEGEGDGSSLHLANLTTCSNCTFRHLHELQIPSLSVVAASLSFDENNLKNLNVPALKSVGQTLSIVSNNLLSDISFPELTLIGGALMIANNTQLTTVDGFKNLTEISGVLNMRGAFDNVSLPKVTSVQGGMSILSSSSDFDCSSLAKVKASARGKTVVCQAQVLSAKPTNADGSHGNTGSAMLSDLTKHYSLSFTIMTAAASMLFI
ncbi:hypothetical protein BGZ94_000992 [Podila epigama]|nr:hypothetical protein BGZ94_000992 [Podila epigama]